MTPHFRADRCWHELGGCSTDGPSRTGGIEPGGTLRVELSATGLDGSHKLSTRLIDPSGAVKAQDDEPLFSHMRLDLDLPADAQPGRYKLVAVLYDPETLAPFADATGQFVTTLSQVEVVGDPAR